MYMESPKRRTSFALDRATLEQLKRLAWRWGVSQAEVVRRAVKSAADNEESRETTVHEKLNTYRKKNKIDADAADRYLNRVEEDRHHWRNDR